MLSYASSVNTTTAAIPIKRPIVFLEGEGSLDIIYEMGFVGKLSFRFEGKKQTIIKPTKLRKKPKSPQALLRFFSCASLDEKNAQKITESIIKKTVKIISPILTINFNLLRSI